jgi:hypothetical protein
MFVASESRLIPNGAHTSIWRGAITKWPAMAIATGFLLGVDLAALPSAAQSRPQQALSDVALNSTAESMGLNPSTPHLGGVPERPIYGGPTTVESMGLNPSAPHLGGVPERPIYGGPARAGGAAGAMCALDIKRQKSSGPLDMHPKITLALWSTYFWDGHYTEKKYYRDALAAFGNDPAFWDRLSEYGVKDGSFPGTIDLTRFGGPSSTVSEKEIQDALTYRFNVSAMTPTLNSIYIILLPHGVQSEYDVSNGFIGHHNAFKYNGQNVWYGVVEYSTNKTQTLSVITHEAYEAATDPDLSTGYWDPANGGETEIGDPCNLITEIFDGYPVQQVWSQKACGCI